MIGLLVALLFIIAVDVIWLMFHECHLHFNLTIEFALICAH